MAPPADPALRAQLTDALRTCRDAVVEYQGGLLDDAQLARSLYEHGLVVGEDEAWILDLRAGRWSRFDGLGVDASSGEMDAPNLVGMRRAIDRLLDDLNPGGNEWAS